MVHNQFNLSRRTIVRTNKFMGNMLSIFKSIHHWEKLEWLAGTNEMATERGPGRLCLHSAVLLCFSNTLNLAGNLHKKKQNGGLLLCQYRWSKSCQSSCQWQMVEGVKGNWKKKWPPRCLPLCWSQREKKLDWRGTSPMPPRAIGFCSDTPTKA